MINNLKKAFALGAVVLAVSGGAAFAAQATGSVNVRTGPSTQYRVVDQLYRGENVNIDARRGSWCHVTKSGPDGWVACSYLTSDRSYRDRPVYVTPRPGVSLSFGFGFPGFGYGGGMNHNGGHYGGHNNHDNNDHGGHYGHR